MIADFYNLTETTLFIIRLELNQSTRGGSQSCDGQRLAKTYNSAAESLLGPVTADTISLGKHTV